MIRVALAIAFAVAACRTPKAPPPAPKDNHPECDASSALAAAMALSADGYLHRALDVIVAGEKTCTTSATIRARAEVLADLGMTEAAIEVYEIYARSPGEAEKLAREAITELRERPPATRETTDDERTKALALYRDGVTLRLQGDSDGAIKQFRRSYALLPHPLTIVQIGRAHAAAGREAEARRSNARAMAAAELVAGTPPAPQLRTGHMGRVRALELQPGGRLLASASEDGTIKLWDTSSGREQRSLSGHTHFVMCIGFSADGQTLASGSRDGTVKLWHASTGEVLHTLDAGGPVNNVAFHPDGSHLVVTTAATLVVWNADSAQLVRTIQSGVGDIRAMALDSTGTRVAVGGTTAAIEMRKFATGELDRVVEGHSKRVNVLEFSPDGQLLASGSDDRTIRFWSVADGLEVSSVVPRTVALDIAFSSDGSHYAHVGDGNKADVRVTGTGEVIGTVEGIHTLAYSSVSARLTTLTTGGMTMWDTDTFEPVARFDRLPTMNAVAFSGDGTQLAIGGYDRHITVWTADDDQPRAIEAHIGAITAIAFPGDRDLVVASGQNMLGVVRLTPSLAASRRVVAENEIRSLAASDSYVAIADGNLVKTWHLTEESLSPAATLDRHDADVLAVTFDNTGTGLATAAQDGAVYLWDVIAGQSFYETRVHEGLPVTDVDIATTQPLVATVGGDGRVTVWNVEKHTGTILEGHQGPTTAVAFTKDDTYIVSAGVDHTIRLWNYVERVDVKTLAAHVSRINDIDVRARDDVVVTASTDGTAKLWDIRRGELLATIATTSDGRWVATAPDGRVTGSDGDDGGVSLVYWQAGDIQLPGFVGWQRWSAPGLVRGILAEEADD